MIYQYFYYWWYWVPPTPQSLLVFALQWTPCSFLGFCIWKWIARSSLSTFLVTVLLWHATTAFCKPQLNSYLLSFHLCWLQAEVIINYHIGETILSLQKTTLIPGGSESLVYTTLSGGIGILVPFTSHEVQFLKFWINSSYARGVLTCNDLS